MADTQEDGAQSTAGRGAVFDRCEEVGSVAVIDGADSICIVDTYHAQIIETTNCKRLLDGPQPGRSIAERISLQRRHGALDTDTCIYALKANINVLANLLSKDREDVAISVITEAELRTGAAKSSSPVKTLRLVENFLRPLTIIDFTYEDAVVYAKVRARLERAGTPIGPLDTIIATQTVARNLTLVTNNEREFRRVSGLRVENWAS